MDYYIGLALTSGAAISGLIGAWYWYRSSAVSFYPDWDFEPVVAELSNMGRFCAIMKGVEISSKLNSLAARWTALSAILSVGSAILAAWK